MSDDPDPDPITVEAHDNTEGSVGRLDHWSEIVRATLVDEGVAKGRLDLIFVDRDEMQALNRQHMGIDRPTDVLAFPLDGPAPGRAAAGDSLDEPPRHLGDVVVCLSVAAEQAAGHSGSLEAELTLLIVHGVLHVLGHDHAEPGETAVMQGRERHHLARYGYPHPVPA